MPILLTTIILTSLICVPMWMWYDLKLHEACRLLKARRDQLLLRTEDRVTDKDIDQFLRRSNYDITPGRPSNR